MTLQMTTPLPAHTLLIEGPDAIAFAQSQFSNNIAALPNGRWQFSAWLDAQGRVRALFHLLRLDDERLLLLLRGDHPDELASSLQQFVFRAKVRLTHSSSSMLACGPARPIFDVNCDGDLIELGCGNHSLLCGNHLSGDDSWRRLQLLDGWAWLPEAATNTLLPPALSMYRLPAVALDKGCYPGQEIVARLHYRGRHKHHLHRVKLSQAVSHGTVLHVEHDDAVQLLQVLPHEHGAEALAVLSDELAERFPHGSEVASDEGPSLRLETGWSD